MSYAVTDRDPTAVTGKRIVAYIADVILGTIIVMAICWPMIQDSMTHLPLSENRCRSVSSVTTPSGPVSDNRAIIEEDACFELSDELIYITDSDMNSISARFYLASFIVQAINYVLLQGLTGASVGKFMVGLRVVNADGQIAGIWRAALRTVLLLIDAACLIIPGLVMVLSTKGHRRLGDMAAKTWVVSTKDVGSPPQFLKPNGGQWAQQGWPQQGWPPQGGPQQGWPQQGGSPQGFPGGPVVGGPPNAANGDGPIWDDARDTYIQFDHNNSRWVYWDQSVQEWIPLEP